MPPPTLQSSGRELIDRKKLLIATILRALIMILRAVDAYFETGVYGKKHE